MKTSLAVLFLASVLFGCGKFWPDSDKEKFLKDCNSEELFGISKENQKEYCDCQLATYQKYFNDAAEMKANLVTMDEGKLAELIQDRLLCMPAEPGK